ncbi:MAG: hypothetical protein HOD63_15545 [Bacteroidetes bacterium]|jgi:hypothetical protein|nr:hypothetical protein [Bacteroidota bacterium]MBT7996146.1 hypothetical protein [Bacteroidota bacterium]
MNPFKSIKIKRTPCYGSCPVYEAEVLADGSVKYIGEMFVKKTGIHKWKLELDKVELLNKLICKYDYFNIEEKECSNLTSCSPSCITTIKLQDGTKRRIENDHGNNKYPDKLKTFENRIDRN